MSQKDNSLATRTAIGFLTLHTGF
jgi:hypothetical protein